MEARLIAVPTRVVPNYVPGRSRRRIPVPFAAMLCGAVPLSLGIAIFLLWVITRWEALEVAGFLTIWAGTIFVAAGCIALDGYVDGSFGDAKTVTINGAAVQIK